MRARPNKTIISGRLQSYTAAPDGFGGEVEILVGDSETPSSEDFVGAKPGQPLRAFYAEASPKSVEALIGRDVKVELTYLGDANGGRTVAQSIRVKSK